MRRLLLKFFVLMMSLILILSCTSSRNRMESETGNTRTEAADEGANIVAAGSTFVYPVMSRWVSDYHSQHSGVQINYQSIGSGGGIQQLKRGLVGFAASDMALPDNELQGMPRVVQIAESAGPVCITYNLPDLKQPLRLSDSTVAGILLGTIKEWQDPRIAHDNPAATLPKTAIIVAHRSDGSGTTNIFTTYLSAVSPDWKSKVGQGLSVSWPIGLGAKGSEGVTGVVKQTPGGIGYVELTYAKTNNLPVAEIRNKAGQWVKPSAEGTTAAIDAFKQPLNQDIRNPIVDAPTSAPRAYPISGLTFLIIPQDGNDVKQRKEIKDFIQYVISAPAQQTAQSLGYAPIPDSLRQTDENLLKQLKANGQPLP